MSKKTESGKSIWTPVYFSTCIRSLLRFLYHLNKTSAGISNHFEAMVHPQLENVDTQNSKTIYFQFDVEVTSD